MRDDTAQVLSQYRGREGDAMDDEEKRFPRITLWQFLAGIFRLIVKIDKWTFDFRPSRNRKSDP
jgi:hypothetical protein